MIYHPWESGTDNSPRWDAALARIRPGQLPAFQRHDLQVVDDPSERPSQLEYERYLWLVERLKSCGYDDARIQREHAFRIRDVLMSAIFAAACAALATVSPDNEAELTAYAERFTRGVVGAWDTDLSLALDFDELDGDSIRVETCAGLAPLLLPRLHEGIMQTVVERTVDDQFAGAPGFAHAVIPSTAAGTPYFHPRAYWRGPAWPVFNWLIWWGLRQHGRVDVAARLRSANLALLATPGADFAEYLEPYTSEPLGSVQQSWTAAVALDWLNAS
jgi:glycogen debranching enzyme